MDLRDYQLGACENVLAKHISGVRRVLLVAPTGSGKTVMAAHLVRGWAAQGLRICFVVHRDELVRQTRAKLEAFGVEHGTIKAGFVEDLERQVQVASIQSLVRRIKRVQPADVLVLDEAHHAAADSYRRLVSLWGKAQVLGLTATPWRTDGRGLSEDFDSTALVSQPAALQEAEYLAPVKAFTYECADLSKVRVRQGEFDPAELAEAMTSIVGDVVGAYQRRGNGGRALLFAPRVSFSRDLAARFAEADISSAHLDAETPHEERLAILDRFRSGETRVLCNVGILTEGFDCPDAEVLILARPTLSKGLYLQMVGRVLRPAPGKSVATILDHSGNFGRHGHPYSEWDYSLEAPKQKAPVERSTPRCPDCKLALPRYLQPGERCPECGYEKEQPPPLAATPATHELEYGNRPTEATKPKEDWKNPEFRRQIFSRWNEYQIRAWTRKKAKQVGPDVAIKRLHWMSGGLLSPQQAESYRRFLDLAAD